jgi:hypothetical protein
LLLGVSVLVAVGAWAVVEGVRADPGVVGALVTAGISAVAAFGVAGYQARLQRQEAAEREHRDAIKPHYDSMIRVFSEYARTAEDRDEATDEEEDALREAAHQMLMWGGRRAIEAFSELSRLPNDRPTRADALLIYTRILRAIREELGHDDGDLEARDLLWTFMPEADEEDDIAPGLR